MRVRAKDGSHACFIQEVIVLSWDNTAGSHHDVGTSKFLGLFNHLRHKCLVACGERRHAEDMNVILNCTASRLGRSLEQRPMSTSNPQSA